MTINNYGTLMVRHTKKVSDKKAWNIAKKALEEEGIEGWNVVFRKDALEIELEDFPNSDLDGDLAKIQDRLKPDVWLDGDISYYGDYDGWIDVKRKGIESGDKSSEDLHYGDDKMLIDELEKRGYVVTKKRKGSKK